MQRDERRIEAMKRTTQSLADTLAPCGLDCASCPDYKDYGDGFSQTSERLRTLLRLHRFASMVATEHGEFDLREFMKGLEWFALQKNLCAGCLRGPKPTGSNLLPGCDPRCPIRACAHERGITICSVCSDFPCFRSTYSPRGLANIRRGFDNRPQPMGH
jgi:hypothetical protein